MFNLAPTAWFWSLVTLVTVAGLAASSAAQTEHVIESVEFNPRGKPAATRFSRLPAERTGIDFAYRWDPPARYRAELPNSVVGSGVCIGDYDGDGRPDVFLTRATGGARLYHNRGDFRFEDATQAAGLGAETAWSTGATFVDIDGDADLDLYVCGYDTPNRLYLNRGDGTFSERAKAYGLDFSGASVMIAFADYDLDGDLDAYLLTNRLSVVADGVPVELKLGPDGKPVVKDPAQREFITPIRREDGSVVRALAGQLDRLYRNNGDGTFTDVSTAAGIDGADYGLGVVWWDYDDDGYPDIYVSNDFLGPDKLYRNKRDGTFEEASRSAFGQTPWYSMGNDVGDIDGDGRLDLMTSDMAGSTHYKSKMNMGDMSEDAWFLTFPEPRQVMKNCLQLNTGTKRFLEVAQMCGLAKSDWTWSVKFADLDDDGRLDLYISNGMTRAWLNSDLVNQARKLGTAESHAVQSFWREQPLQRDTNAAYRNRGFLDFEDVGRAWGLAHEGVSFGAAFGDLDGDGDLDLVVNNFEETASVYRNDGADGHAINLRLVGADKNRFGIGARVSVVAGGHRQTRQLTLARGFMSANEPIVHFGLGDATTVERLEIRWPRGTRQVFRDLAADRRYTIREPAAEETLVAGKVTPPTWFTPAKALARVRHRERPFDDFQVQPLLPNKLSRLGPGIAFGDANGDGIDDVYLAGGSGQRGMLLFGKGDATFRWSSNLPFDRDRRAEEIAPLFFDADGDGDQDLYVSHGGYEFAAHDEALRDRLYLNDGKGRFTVAPPGTIPDLRDVGSTVAAADFDRDGDLDLFVGSRVRSEQYPISPSSRLLRNDRGTFHDVAPALAPALRKAGMVTGAVWSDVDADGWVDLMVTCEYGPVRCFLNRRGRLEESTGPAGLTDRTGWWNGIAAADVDHDGDIDFAVTNFGLNTKYHPSAKKPQRIYYGDFEGTGLASIVEAKKDSAGRLLPQRGKSCSQNAIPFIRDRFPKFHDFASAGMKEIYSAECLDSAFKVEVNTLESGLLINDGRGRFTFSPLPRIAQTSPGFGVAFTDADADGHPDLYFAQNFYHPQPETPRMDGGVSLLLRGDGTSRFEPVGPDASGLVVPGDARAVALTDLDRDGRDDVVVTVNDGFVRAFVNRRDGAKPPVLVRLRGRAGNPTAVGARVTAHAAGRAPQTREVTAGHGYASQSTAALAFAGDGNGRVDRIDVRWPDGERSTHEAPSRKITIEQPTPSGSEATAVEPRWSHAAMVALLQDIHDTSPRDLLLGRAAEHDLRRRAVKGDGAPVPARVRTLVELGQLELRLGREREAIAALERAHALASGAGAEHADLVTSTAFGLAIAFLRLAERENCCALNNPASCILPFTADAVHKRTAGSKGAIRYLTQVLAKSPAESAMHLQAVWLLNIAHITLGTHPDGVPEAHRISLEALGSPARFPRFTNVARARGVGTFSLSGGAIGDDFDDDGDIDLVVSTHDSAGQLRFFANDGKGRFTDRTDAAGLRGIVGGLNLVQADYDNDGDLDVLVLRGGWRFAHGAHPNSLLRNDDGVFTDVTFAAGLGGVHYPTQTAAWADYDLDGDLDLYIGNESERPGTTPGQLFVNQGDGTFVDSAKTAGVTNDRFAKAVVWGDYDGDRDPDLFVSNYRAANRLYRNNGDGTFTDVAASAGVEKPMASFPAWFWDFDNDGKLDLYASAYVGGVAEIAAAARGKPKPTERARLYRGDGRGDFEDVTAAHGLERPHMPMGANFGDVDLDGYLDFYLGTGWPDLQEVMPSAMFRNDRGKGFVDVTLSGGFGHLQKGHAIVFADFDQDGDTDVFAQMGGFYPGDKFHDALYENPGFGTHWIGIDLRGKTSNRLGVGARIKVDFVEDGKPRSVYRHVNSGGSFGANPLRQTIGLGSATRVTRLEVFWPRTGKTDVFESLEVDRVIRITEDSGQ